VYIEISFKIGLSVGLDTALIGAAESLFELALILHSKFYIFQFEFQTG